jgi:transcriptional regulator with XRE-family HTH domain
MDPELPFGDRLDRWLAFLGMRQSTLARALQLKPPTVNAWIAGREAPRSDRLPAIAAALNMSLSEFFGPLPKPGLTLAEETAHAPPPEEEISPHPFTGEDTREIPDLRVVLDGRACESCNGTGIKQTDEAA